jgi:hypothetical protein
VCVCVCVRVVHCVLIYCDMFDDLFTAYFTQHKS